MDYLKEISYDQYKKARHVRLSYKIILHDGAPAKESG